MNINPISGSKSLQTEPVEADEPIQTIEKTNASTATGLDTETKSTLDHATGLLQAIVSDTISDKVIRKMPSDEYLHLLSLLDEIISGSVDKRV